ncbi:hypothetical protein L1N85_15230 [Paenibacillus alkaliterrae]|uniref:hypothetical protein n=1 Tax=Paenibacillus alkaliterrae TaxID=320909 RepID=UPI001F3AAB7E|nr:hypothetical protein [Paenibacillus alkaliterrae]MCF2939772.1 hypothetical protein [Paenibacillus alkaliterrae]
MSNKQRVICDTNIYIYASWDYKPAVELINELRFDYDIELLMPKLLEKLAIYVHNGLKKTARSCLRQMPSLPQLQF